PSSLVFTTSKEQLYHFYQSHPGYEAILTTLLRTYEGIFDIPVFISEGLLAKLLRLKEEEIKAHLKQIAAFGIISYTPQSDEPQILFCKNRVAVDDLYIDLSVYNKRKNAFLKRVEEMIAYIETTTCRSLFINHYFGDADTAPCRICDCCLCAKKITLSAEEFEQIHEHIKNCLKQTPLTASELLTQLKGVQKEKAWKVIDFLQAENKLGLNNKGLIMLK
ncbi:MAG: RecQ family zinc-binding domain-containing protein, partial [Flavisolibacter sp.]|nr:RecQ family zinc-binding domain-containing protein [Flavisolibacter sp.]